MATITGIGFDGIRHVLCGVRSTSTATDVTIVDAALVTPRCRSFRLMKIVYDVGPGNIAGIYFGPAANGNLLFLLSPGNGQTVDFHFRGGIFFNGVGNNIITVSTSIAGPGGVPDGVCFTMNLIKRY